MLLIMPKVPKAQALVLKVSLAPMAPKVLVVPEVLCLLRCLLHWRLRC